EFYPEEGKYHFDGHRLCGVRFSPEETKKHNGICPVCKRQLTIGVMNRVEQLADRPANFVPKNAVPFEWLVPLKEILAEVYGKKEGSKAVEEEYYRLVKHFGNEFAVLHAKNSELKKAAGERLAEAIRRVEEGRVKKVAGYDGEYGKIIIFDEAEKERGIGQKTLGDF
ncbi:MAG: endonuclease Q family protein, partial [Candidatus Micrarchaeota archaeon]|nr:endonuclease Q family protein [Candidatus Micrarchaeota archaeon]